MGALQFDARVLKQTARRDESIPYETGGKHSELGTTTRTGGQLSILPPPGAPFFYRVSDCCYGVLGARNTPTASTSQSGGSP